MKSIQSPKKNKDAGASPRRFLGAPARAIPLLRDVEKALDGGDLVTAERLLALALIAASAHPHTLCLLGRSHHLRGRWADAITTYEEVLALAPDDVGGLIGLGKAHSAMGDGMAAGTCLRRAVELQPSLETLIELGIALDASADADGALDVADRMLALDSAFARARLLRARCLQALGRIAATAAEYRELIRRRQELPAAWFALMDIKTIRLSGEELASLKRDQRDSRWNDIEKSLLGFALGRACEDAVDYPGAVAALDEANRLVRARTQWSAARWSRDVDALLAAFDRPSELVDTTTQHGGEVIFIVGLPRSGTTVIEQILGSHSQVEGANELPDLAAVIDAETARCKCSFPEWASIASDDDWHRLGREYLRRTERWRRHKPIHTDKMPENWPYTGAIRRMLPAARIIDSRRDPVETAWSCYKQLFAPHRVAYSYSAAELGAYWRDYDRFMKRMAALHPQQLHVVTHESLTANVESEIRSLLAWCGLPFETACLEWHHSTRAVRTASSGQVRQALRTNTAQSLRYAEHLAEFRVTFDRHP